MLRSKQQVKIVDLITKTSLFKYIENFTNKITESFQLKILIYFKFLLKNIDYGYTLRRF